MDTTITVHLSIGGGKWNAMFVEEGGLQNHKCIDGDDLDTMPYELGNALEYFVDANILTPIARTILQDDKGLPEQCYAYLQTTGEIAEIFLGRSGYTPVQLYDRLNEEQKRDTVAHLNRLLGVTPAQAKAMEIGSMFGWGCPGADPDNYNEDGTPKKEMCE